MTPEEVYVPEGGDKVPDIPVSGNPRDFGDTSTDVKMYLTLKGVQAGLDEAIGEYEKKGGSRKDLISAWEYYRGAHKKAEIWDNVLTLAEQIEQWVSEADPVFTLNQCYTDLHVRNSYSDMCNVRAKFRRLKNKGEIEFITKGTYRKVDKTAEIIEWWGDMGNAIDLKLPFDLHDKIYIYPGNMFIIAGVPDTGKTAFVVETIGRNIDTMPIGDKMYWWNSDSARAEISRRILADPNVDKELWRERVVISERGYNFQDVIVPNSLNMIDYMAVNDFTEVGKYLDPIYEKLKLVNSLGIICLQKTPGSNYGRGGTLTLDRPRLYVTLDKVQLYDETVGRARIMKAKNKKVDYDLTNHCRDFRVQAKGSTIVEINDWRYRRPDNIRRKD
jgi:hypothetical protein